HRDTNHVRARIGISMRAAARARWTRLVTPVNDRAPDGVLRGASRGGGYRERRRATAGRNRKRTAWRRIGSRSGRGHGLGRGASLVATVGCRDTNHVRARIGISIRAAAPVRWTRLVTPVNDLAPDGVLRAASRGGALHEALPISAGRNRKRTAWRRIGSRSGRGHGLGRGAGLVATVGCRDTSRVRARIG